MPIYIYDMYMMYITYIMYIWRSVRIMNGSCRKK